MPAEDDFPEIRCGVCQRSIDEVAFMHQQNGCHRCDKHIDRNPCAIDGCQRTQKAKNGYSDDDWVCSEHWKIICPPRSKLRAAYNRFWRISRRGGWTPALGRRFWRFWRGLLKRGQRKCAGDIDQAEIDRLFGWD